MSIATKAAKLSSQGGMVGRVPYGDPGLLGSIGNFLGKAAGAVGGFLVGGPAGAVAGYTGASKLLGGGGGGGQQYPVTMPTNLPAVPQPGVGGAISRILPGGQSGYVSAAKPAGTHLNKSGYWLKDGTYVPPQSRYVRNRRRDPMNPRALRRAIGRIDAAKIWQHKLHGITTEKYTSAGTRK